MRYSISEVSRAFGIAVSTLRYYDELELLKPAERRGNVRYYGEAQLRRLAWIRRLHHDGTVSLADTAALLAAEPRQESRQVLERSIGDIKTRIASLRRAQRLLEHVMSCPRPDPVRHCEKLHAELDKVVRQALGR
ncbi:MerR family transcriptional regulator [Fodinicola acaciae]|uniref:helix-turn-helix domain-containing protein n=1 Tax=Fodinicola acaciae TaxID=2681555 RepID=UPI0013D7A834|nr:MerR family transcriptional regulator [Fodinicola acaciae]